ncbi:MAG: amidase [Anaerolineales bacterium]|nr:amidase [Anaerolineales bacterium]MCS7246646.1 amidase [Anaerolineales bacterium]MDW8160456.1 amidase [Anaerolineales bacterium]MDW8446070.1 amidase [Anaerolineales bacterium]
MNIQHLTLTEAKQLIQNREITPLELTQAVIERIERHDPVLNCYLSVFREEALSKAERLSKAFKHPRPLSPLYGIPIGIKDIISIRGHPLRAGSKVWEGYTPDQDARVVERVRQSGAILIGYHNMHEIALGVTNLNPHFGAVRNPWRTDRISGGSSGGSAAAVVAGLCLGAIGTDTGGSIRIPASLCGAVGLKPTFGRVSLRGVLPLSWNLDHVGPLGRCVEDVALLYRLIAGNDPQDATNAQKPLRNPLPHLKEGVKGLRIALAEDEFFTQAEEEVLRAVRLAADVLRELGAVVEPICVPEGALAAQTNALMVISDAAAIYEKQLSERPQQFGEDVLQRLRNGAAVAVTQYVQARRTQAILQKRYRELFKRYNLLLTPTTPIAAPAIVGQDSLEAAKVLTRFTSPFNLTGLPALSLPCGFNAEGLPIGLQIVADHWQEELLLRAGYAYEQATQSRRQFAWSETFLNI